MFELVIHSIFIKKTNRVSDGSAAHGGSSSNAIGSIWLSLNDDLSTDDICELLIHELTHHLLFIDEYCHYHFEYSLIGEPANFAQSAIRKSKRPLDKVVHSIVVAAELVSARSAILDEGACTPRKVHPDTPTVISATFDACDSVLALSNLPELVSDRTVDLVNRSKRRCLDARSATALVEEA